MIKWTVYYKLDGQTWSVQLEKPNKIMFDYMSQEEYDKRPEYKYYLETEKGLVECTKDKKAINKRK